MSVKFKSDIFDSPEELLQAKDDAWALVVNRRKRHKLIRQFSNGLATMSEEEAQELGRTEIVNHLSTYSKLLQQATMFQSMVTGTNALVEVIVDTDNPEQDTVLGQRISEAINRGAIHNRGLFANFWKKVSGETVISGGVPVGHRDKHGWLPRMQFEMFFPKGTELHSDAITYAFNPEQFTLSDLRELYNGTKTSRVIHRENIQALIDHLTKQIEGNSKDSGGSEFDRGSVREAPTPAIATIDCWEYYEVKERSGKRYVSKTIFTHLANIEFENDDKDPNEPGSSGVKIISYVEKAFDSPASWLTFAFVDSEIGGEQTTDTVRGVAELLFPSATELEELINLLLEGDKIRARPKMKVTSAANVDSVLKWDIAADTLVPDGMEEFSMGSNSNHLQTPMGLLDQITSGITGTPVSAGNGNELRVQALERQEAGSSVQSTRLASQYDNLDIILESIVERLLLGKAEVGQEGYNEIKWVQSRIDSYGIDREVLCEKEFGRFKYIRVRAARVIGSGDRVQQLRTADWLMANINSYPPANRPLILHQATSLRTQDPDLADRLVQVPEVILNQQKVIAENEFDTISRRAILGQALPVGVDDIHQDHLPVHLLDMQAHLAKDSFQPWNLMDTIIFAALVEHVGDHLQILIGHPATNMEGNQYLPAFQELVNAARPIVERVQEENDQAQQQEPQLTPAEQMRFALESAKLELKATELGIRLEDMQNLREIRNSRARLSQRNQYSKEVFQGRGLALQEKALDIQRQNQTSSQE